MSDPDEPLTDAEEAALREYAKHHVRSDIDRLLATLDAERARPDAGLREAAQVILDRCLDFFGPDDLDPESSEAMPVVIKNRWVYDLQAALAAPTPEEPTQVRGES